MTYWGAGLLGSKNEPRGGKPQPLHEFTYMWEDNQRKITTKLLEMDYYKQGGWDMEAEEPQAARAVRRQSYYYGITYSAASVQQTSPTAWDTGVRR